MRLALKLGVEFEKIGTGVNGSYFGLDRFRNKMVVFKPGDEENLDLLSRTAKNHVKSCFPFGNISSGQGFINEAAASGVDTHLKLNVVPTTKLETFESAAFSEKIAKEGSCQLFVEGAQLARSAYQIPNWVPITMYKLYMRIASYFKEPLIDQKEFEKFVILDFIIGNQDRHFDNFLLKGDKVSAIDNGNSLPNRKPEEYFSWNGLRIEQINQYSWTYLPEAKRAFSEDAYKLIEGLANEEKREALFNEIKKIMGKNELGDEIFTPEKKKEMNDRIDILLLVVGSEGSTPAELGKIRTEGQFARARGETHSWADSVLALFNDPSLKSIFRPENVNLSSLPKNLRTIDTFFHQN